jgi:FtsH-binding integral membrane protein
MPLALTIWDGILIAGVCAQTTAIAYLHQPARKALVYTLPIPFTLASFAAVNKVDVTHMSGLMLLLLYTHVVRILATRCKVPIVLAIAGGALFYGVSAVSLAKVLPRTETAFWVAVAVNVVVSVTLLKLMPQRDEPGHRTPLPIYLKLPMIVAFVVLLVMAKQYLQGFMATSPMVGLVGAYEARHSLWTMSRQLPILLLTVTPLMIVCHLFQDTFGLPIAMALGWLLFSTMLCGLTLYQHRHSARVRRWRGLEPVEMQ